MADGGAHEPAGEVLPLFPSFVWKTRLGRDARERVNAAVLERLGALRAGQPPLGRGESWQSHQELHELAELGELMGFVRACAERVLAFLKVLEGELEVTACWVNVNGPGAGHRTHTHPNNYLSGVYYVRTRAGANTVNFHDPRAQTAVMRPPVTELTGYNTDHAVVEVLDGMLLLFPAWLAHSVDPNRSADERVSVSFNLMFSRYTERMTRPLWEGGLRGPDT